jgi:hypothetical protein
MALFLPRFNLVFIHIYKTAGTATRLALMKEDMEYSEIGGSHADYKEISENLDFKKSTFSIVRNPYEWIYSVYEYAKYYDSHSFHNYCISHNFSEFVHWFFDNKEELQKYVNGKLQSQTEYLSDENGIKVNYVLKMENLQTDFNTMFDVLRYSHIIIGNENTTPYIKGTWRKEADKYAINKINQEYRNDFQNFNYKMI